MTSWRQLFFAPPRFAAARLITRRTANFFATLLLAAFFFAAPFLAAPLRARRPSSPTSAWRHAWRHRGAPSLLRSASLAAALLLRCHRCVSSAGWWLSVLREIVAVCARFGRMVASVDPAVTSAATACVVRSRDVAARTACASPRRCVRPSGARRRRSGTATTGTWSLATQPASGAAIRIASPMLAGRRVATARGLARSTLLLVMGAFEVTSIARDTAKTMQRERGPRRSPARAALASGTSHLASP